MSTCRGSVGGERARQIGRRERGAEAERHRWSLVWHVTNVENAYGAAPTERANSFRLVCEDKHTPTGSLASACVCERRTQAFQTPSNLQTLLIKEIVWQERPFSFQSECTPSAEIYKATIANK